MTKVSIITVNFNNLVGLQKTVESVLSQTYKNVEYIVIDGASEDGSVEYLTKYKSNFAHFISEKDNGIYHAMNKAIHLASGEYLLFLNSGDWLCEKNTIQSVFSENHIAAVVHCNLLKVDASNNIHRQNGPNFSRITQSFFYYSTINHQSSFIRSSMFQKYGSYNEHYKIVSDWAFYLKLAKNGETFRYVDVDVAYFEMGGAASQNLRLNAKEKELEIEKGLSDAEINDYKQVRKWIALASDGASLRRIKEHKLLWFLVRVYSKVFSVKL